MAYSFPPRGFSPPVNNPRFPPHLSTPPIPPPPQPFRAFPQPPTDHPGGRDRPPFSGGAPPFGPQPSAGFLHRANMPHARAVRPGGRGGWAGERAAWPGAPAGQFPYPHFDGLRPQRSVRPCPPFEPWHPQPGNMSDITRYESWPGTPGQNVNHRGSREKHPHGHAIPGSGPHAEAKDGHQWGNAKKRGQRGGSSQQKNKRKRPSGKKQNAPNNGQGQAEEFCDMCDRSFKSKALLDDHISQHVKCDHPGCKYEAHFKMIKMHKKLQHEPGGKTVAWLDTPSEITKWRAERKRNYPSAENIARKQEAMKTNQAKGVVLQNKYFGKMRQPKRARASPAEDGGTAPKRANLGALSALAAYGDSEEEEGEIQDEDNSTAEGTKLPVRSPASFRGNKRECLQGPKRRKAKKKRGNRGGKKVQDERERERQQKLKRRPNLLEMLLAPEIRQERNTILQCVRFVVQNDFFGVNQTKETESRAQSQRSHLGVDAESDEAEAGTAEEATGPGREPGCGDEDESGQGDALKDCRAETDSPETGRRSERRPQLGTGDLAGVKAAETVETTNGDIEELSAGADDLRAPKATREKVEGTTSPPPAQTDESCTSEAGDKDQETKDQGNESDIATGGAAPEDGESDTRPGSCDVDEAGVTSEEPEVCNSASGNSSLETVGTRPHVDPATDRQEEHTRLTSPSGNGDSASHEVGKKLDMQQQTNEKEAEIPLPSFEAGTDVETVAMVTN